METITVRSNTPVLAAEALYLSRPEFVRVMDQEMERKLRRERNFLSLPLPFDFCARAIASSCREQEKPASDAVGSIMRGFSLLRVKDLLKNPTGYAGESFVPSETPDIGSGCCHPE